MFQQPGIGGEGMRLFFSLLCTCLMSLSIHACTCMISHYRTCVCGISAVEHSVYHHPSVCSLTVSVMVKVVPIILYPILGNSVAKLFGSK